MDRRSSNRAVGGIEIAALQIEHAEAAHRAGKDALARGEGREDGAGLLVAPDAREQQRVLELGGHLGVGLEHQVAGHPRDPASSSPEAINARASIIFAGTQ